MGIHVEREENYIRDYLMYVTFFEQYERALKSFCEDAKQQPDEFFLVFDTFLSSFTEAKNDNEKIKKMKIEEEKRAKLEQVCIFSIFV